MGTNIQVICRSANPLTRNQITAWLDEVAILDRPPAFDPPLGDPAGDIPDWDYLEIVYRPKKRPILIHRYAEHGRVGEMAGEVVERMEIEGLDDDHPELVERLKAARQVFFFEMGSSLPTDIWEMVDLAEAFIAEQLDGLVAADEGIYDHELQPLVKYGEDEE